MEEIHPTIIAMTAFLAKCAKAMRGEAPRPLSTIMIVAKDAEGDGHIYVGGAGLSTDEAKAVLLAAAAQANDPELTVTTIGKKVD